MDRYKGQFAAQQRELIAQNVKNAEVRRRYLIDEIAYALFEQLISTTGKISFLPSSEYKFLSDFDRGERTFLICRLYEHLIARDHQPSASDFLLPEECAAMGEHIVYVQNYYTERAYEFFAEELHAPTVSYASDFTDACAEVGEGLADLCILPFRDGRWGAFHSFSRMPEDYGLTVRAVCTVDRADGETMRLSLCGRGCSIPKNAKEIAVEFLFSSQEGEDFEDVRHLVHVLGGQTVFAEALPDRYTAMISWRVTYKVQAESLAPLLLGRRILASESELLGIYKMPSLFGGEG